MLSILLVEDEDSVRSVVSRLLRRLGFDVVAAPDAETALDLFEEAAGRFDLVVTDIVMPGLSGIEMADVMRERYPGTRFLFVSGYTSREFSGTPSAPPQPFLAKPFTMEELRSRVHAALKG